MLVSHADKSGFSFRALPHPLRRPFSVSDGGGKSDAPWMMTDDMSQPLQLAKNLTPSVGAHHGVQFVQHHKAKIAKQAGQIGAAVHEHTFQRLGGDLEDTAGVLQCLCLVACRHVAMPMAEGDVAHVKKLGQTLELIVDQTFEGGDIQYPKASAGLFDQPCQNGEKDRLGLSRCRGGADQQIVLRVEKDRSRIGLYPTHLHPALAIDKFLYQGGVSLKNIHRGGSFPFIYPHYTPFLPYCQA